MKTKPSSPARDATLAKTLAPEDVRPGDYVAVLDEEQEYAALAWLCEPVLGRETDVIRVRFRRSDSVGPLRVLDACLPFVYVEPPKGAGQTLDLRAVRLARLDRDYARRVCAAILGRKKRKRRK